MNAHGMAIDEVINRLVDSPLVIGFALLFPAGVDVPRADQIDADFFPNVHLGFGPQILKRDVHTVIVKYVFPLAFFPRRVSTASLSQEPADGVPFPSRGIARVERWTRRSTPMYSSGFHSFTLTGRGGGYTGRNEEGDSPKHARRSTGE